MPDISYQLYSSRNFPDLARQAAMLAGLGLRHVEPFGGQFGDISVLQSVLAANGLQAPTAHIGAPALRQDFEGTMAKLKEIGVRFDIILTSPLVRARQTTDILLKTGLSSTTQEFADLAPEGNIQNWLSWLVASDYYQEQGSLALVGHQPDLGNWAEILVWGQTQEKLILKKAGVIALELPIHEHPIGQGLLFLLTSPKFINQ